MIKITNVTYRKDDQGLTVWTDEFPNLGFGFSLDEFETKEFLLELIEARVKKEQEKLKEDASVEIKKKFAEGLIGSKLNLSSLHNQKKKVA